MYCPGFLRAIFTKQQNSNFRLPCLFTTGSSRKRNPMRKVRFCLILKIHCKDRRGVFYRVTKHFAFFLSENEVWKERGSFTRERLTRVLTNSSCYVKVLSAWICVLSPVFDLVHKRYYPHKRLALRLAIACADESPKAYNFDPPPPPTRSSHLFSVALWSLLKKFFLATFPCPLLSPHPVYKYNLSTAEEAHLRLHAKDNFLSNSREFLKFSALIGRRRNVQKTHVFPHAQHQISKP